VTLRQAQDRRFGEAAARLFGAASALLGWRPDEFWGATPRELADALQPQRGIGESPDPNIIEALLRRFPDEER